MASMLYGEDVPRYGSDTLFANQYLAYETLSPAMQRMLEGIRVVYSDTRFSGPTAGRNAQSATKSREDAGFHQSRACIPWCGLIRKLAVRHCTSFAR
jgi:taurine dioxygenase